MEQESKKRWEKIKEGLQHRYRLVAMNDDTFEEVGSYRLTLLNVYITSSVIFVILVFLVVLMFIFTPVKQYLPGYGDVNQREEFYKIEKRLRALEKELTARDIYINSVKNALTNNVEYEPENIPEESIEEPDSNNSTKLIAEDYQLRKEVERAERGTPTEVTSNFTLNTKSIEQLFFVPPIKGTTSAGFRPDKKHFGIDIIAPRNTPIIAVADGVVITSDWTYATGNVIAVQHENNIVSFYKHNSVLLKKVGNFVKAGEAVAIIGNTGEQTDGPHLHFELWYNGNPVDPAEYIKFN
jgi:murein DD-endopeptidase MepM/ murein hydrolase activator NlpD